MSKRRRLRGHTSKSDRSVGPTIICVSMRRPLTPAAISVASVMLTTSALGQSSETLPTIEVQGQTGGGYQATGSTIGRLPVPLRDTPQTVNVVTQQVIQDQ